MFLFHEYQVLPSYHNQNNDIFGWIDLIYLYVMQDEVISEVDTEPGFIIYFEVTSDMLVDLIEKFGLTQTTTYTGYEMDDTTI
jgi:hypothetical protein